MKCPGRTCDTQLKGDEVACESCLSTIHVLIRVWLFRLKRAPNQAPYQQLVASVGRLLRDGDAA